MSLLMTGFTLVRGLKGIPPLAKILTTSLTEIVFLPISAPSTDFGIPSHKTLSAFKYLQHLKIETLKIEPCPIPQMCFPLRVPTHYLFNVPPHWEGAFPQYDDIEFGKSCLVFYIFQYDFFNEVNNVQPF